MLSVSRRALIAGLASLPATSASAFWQSRDSNYNLAISGAPPPAGITLVGTATGTTTCTVPAHVAGDLILIFGFRSATGSPALPSGFLNIANGNGTTCSARVGWKIATGTGDTSGTWTNSAALVCHVYRPPSGYTLGIGATSAIAHVTTNTINYPAITLADPSGNSWVAGFTGVNNLTNTIATAPSGMTNESHETAAAAQAAGHDTEGGVTSWASTNVTTTGTAGDSATVVVELLLLPNGAILPLPSNIYQHIGGGTNPNNNTTGQASSTVYTCPLVYPSGSGNCLVLAVTHDNGTTISSVADNINGTWGAAVVTQTSSGNQDSSIFVLPNIGSGQTTITVTLGTATLSFQYDITELYGVATSSATNGSTAANIGAGPTLAAGSFTPGANTGGNLVWAYFSKSQANQTASHFGTRIVARGGLVPLGLDISNNSPTYSFDHASAVLLQSTPAAINPTFSCVGDTDPFNVLAVAIKISSGAGTPPPSSGLRMMKIQHFTTLGFPTSGTYAIQASTTGNLRCIGCTDPALNTLTVTDSEGNTWVNTAASAGFWFSPNAVVNPNLMIFITGGGGDGKLSWRFFDISGAATSPFDSFLVSSQDASSRTTLTQSPSPSPVASAGLLIANVELGLGPGLAVTSPSGAVWDLANYTGENDSDCLENADICAHYYFSASGAETWTFTITSHPGINTAAGYIAFTA